MPSEPFPVLELGGTLAGFWDAVEPAVRLGLSGVASDLDHLEIRPAERSSDAALPDGACWSVYRRD